MLDEKAVAIIHQLTGNKSPDTDPSFLLIGGGMQTGQGSFLSMLTETGVVDKSRTVIITPAAFLSMPGFESVKDVQHPEKMPHLLPLYQEIVRNAVSTAVKNGYSIVLVDHAEDPAFVQSLHDICKQGGYRTLLAGMASSAESYFNYAHCTEELFDRKTDHARGFRFLRDFARNFDEYLETFDQTALFETHFSRNADEPHIAVRKIADFEYSLAHGVESFIYDRPAMAHFYDNRYLDIAAATPDAAASPLPARENFCTLPRPPQVPELLVRQDGIAERFAAATARRDMPRDILKQFRKIMSALPAPKRV